MPEEKRSNWSQIFELLRDEVHAYMSDLISYILYLELNQYSSEAWGNGLFVFGMWPDSELFKEENAVRRRFMLNKRKSIGHSC